MGIASPPPVCATGTAGIGTTCIGTAGIGTAGVGTADIGTAGRLCNVLDVNIPK